MALITKELWLNWKLDLLKWFGWKNWLLLLMQEQCAPVYGLLKRPDEKFVTEQAYDNPRFVEDAVREIALRLEADKRIIWYKATVESIESIHNHNAFACVEKGWKDVGI